MDVFLHKQYDICETVCNMLDAVSLSSLSRVNKTLESAVADFHAEPEVLVLDQNGGGRAFNPITLRFRAMARPQLDPAIDGTERPPLDWVGVCPSPAIEDLPGRVWELYESFMMADWRMGNLNDGIQDGPPLDGCICANDLRVFILRKHLKMWLIDPVLKRKVLLPDFLDVVESRRGIQRNRVRVTNFTYQNGRLLVVGAVDVIQRNRMIRQNKLFAFDLRSHVRKWRLQSDDAMRVAFVERVGKLTRMLEKYCAPISELLEPHILLNLQSLSLASQMNVLMLVTVINTGIVVNADDRFVCLGRVPRLTSNGPTHFDLFSASGLVLLRANQRPDRYYLVSTKRGLLPGIVASGSFRGAGVKPSDTVLDSSGTVLDFSADRPR